MPVPSSLVKILLAAFDFLLSESKDKPHRLLDLDDIIYAALSTTIETADDEHSSNALTVNGSAADGAFTTVHTSQDTSNFIADADNVGVASAASLFSGLDGHGTSGTDPSDLSNAVALYVSSVDTPLDLSNAIGLYVSKDAASLIHGDGWIA